MLVESIHLINFKNYPDFKIDLKSTITCVVGNNGMGKTNFLDAVYYACLSKSYFNALEKHNVRNGQNFFTVQILFNSNKKKNKVFCNYVLGEKKVLKLNNKPYDKVADHIGKFPCVMITPGDLYLINEYSDERRKFVDSIIAQYDPKYLEILIQYNRVLSQRNALLKSAQKTTFLDMDLIQVLDQQLESFGKGIYKGRKEFIERFLPILSEVYKEISGGKEEITCLYTCQLEEHDLGMLLAKDLDKDKIMGRTHSGIHKDDFVFLMNELPVKKYGSQGQQKSFVFALKLAQTRIIFEQSGQFPIILLDDVFDRLDQERMKNLMSYLFEQSFGHLFLSDTESERVVNILKDYQMDYELISIDNGNLAVDENKKKD